MFLHIVLELEYFAEFSRKVFLQVSELSLASLNFVP